MTFNITLLPSGKSFASSADETILAAGLRQGVSLYHGCQVGECGSCKCRVITGTAVQDDEFNYALTPEEAADGFVLACSAVAASDLVLEATVLNAAAAPSQSMTSRVLSLERKSPDVMVVELGLPIGAALTYQAGQYIEILLKDSIRRRYSVANLPQPFAAFESQLQRPPIELHIRHMPGGKFTDYVFGSLKDGDELVLEGPFGSFFLREDSDKPMILLASGTGFAPIKAIIELMRAKSITRPATVYWGGRRPSDLYMNDWLLAQLAQMPQLRYIPVISDAMPGDGWTGRTGFVHAAVLEDFPDLSNYQVYACGAPIVVDSARKQFTCIGGLPATEFHADSFVSEADKARGENFARQAISTS